MSTSSVLPVVLVFVALVLSVNDVVLTDAAVQQDSQSGTSTPPPKVPVYVVETVIGSPITTDDTDHEPLPAQPVRGQQTNDDSNETSVSRRRRAMDRPVSSSDASWRNAVENQLNSFRRTVSASNMYYASWNGGLEPSVASLVTSCRIQTKVEVPPQYAGASGLAGLMNPASDMSEELRQIFLQGPSNQNHQQMMQWSMTGFACVIGRQQCAAVDQRTNRTMPVKLFACLFTYSKPNSPNLYAYNGVNCSLCDIDSLWCDGGLCRGSSSCPAKDTRCNYCQTFCSDCRRTSTFDCQCICYYDSGLTGNGTRRCSESADGSQYQPLCLAPDVITGGRPGIRVVSIVAAVCSALLVFSSIMFIGYRVHWCRSRSANQPSEQGHYDDVTYGGSTLYDHDTSGVRLSGTSIMTPPPYHDSKPPAYYLDTSAPPMSGRFDDVDLVSNERMVSSNMAAENGSVTAAERRFVLLTSTTSTAHDNQAFSTDEKQ